MIAGKFKQYIPDDEHLLKDAQYIKNNTGMDVIFLCDENGRNWYEIQTEFDPNKIKIMYDDDGIIRSISNDVSSLNPVDSFVAEIELNNFPNDVDIFGGWKFDGSNVSRVSVDYVVENERIKSKLISEATLFIAPLQDAVDLSMATTEETDALLQWKKYRVLLNRVDPNAPDWPPKPVNG
ncbi:tail fiber assembly protein [Enterobacter ludwigii]|uniref:tail fiber assembly protein n=1 Tax=Enterobacter ludwigii TaxID=299767 RepID=UPI00129CE747|nr:tail fiber assembly protein [Enterobacter ludwigii]MRI47957.1 tail fiber assembly protein [Enterobacter ludwigii]